jgi:hypothetical protein
VRHFHSNPLRPLDRRRFFQSAAVAATSALGASLPGNVPRATAAPDAKPADAAVKALYDSLSEVQRKAFAFDWDRKGYGNLPLRLHVTNNWAVSNTKVGDLTKDQQALVEEILRSVLNPGWPEKLARQAKDDTGKPWTEDRKIALFGTPDSGKCQCVISGFHLTFRAGGDPLGTRSLRWCHLPRPSAQRLSRETGPPRQHLLVSDAEDLPAP